MKEVKFLLKIFTTVFITSTWWSGIMFRSPFLLAVAILMSLIIVVMAIIYLENHWHEG